MRVDLFDYDLPKTLIAKYPARPRDSARLLDMTGDRFCDRTIRDLPLLLQPNDLLVVNDTRVIPARLDGHRDSAVVEVTLHKRLGPGRWAAFARPAKQLRRGDTIAFADSLSAKVVRRDGGEVELDFAIPDMTLLKQLHDIGRMPLPPYIRRQPDGAAADRADYQTIFATRDGAVAAPTASLHFTSNLVAAIAARGACQTTVTLHVGAGTFLPVTAADTEQHVMHSEWGEVSQPAVDAIRACRTAGGRVVAAGTTSLRILETAASNNGLNAFSGETDLFIVPGYRFKVVDALLTNFHQPRSTLLMLVSAFAGRERIYEAYRHAIDRQYRFFSYGDACLMARSHS